MHRSPSAPPDPASLLIPPELRGCIARFCDRQSLGRLASVDRLWAAESEPILYHSVHLTFFDFHSAETIRGCIDGLARVPHRAACVRRLLVDDSAYYASSANVLAVAGVLANTTNLIDLRLRGDDLDFQAQLLLPLASPNCCFRLHTLYLSQRRLHHIPSFFWDLLRSHGAFLRVFAVELDSPAFVWDIVRFNGAGELPGPAGDSKGSLLHVDCAQFAFYRQRTPSRSVTLSILDATVSRVEAVAQSLDEDPCVWVSSTDVEMLQLDGPGAGLGLGGPTSRHAAELSRAYHAQFPLARTIEMLIPTGTYVVELDAVLEAVLPFAAVLSELRVVGYRRRIAARHNHFTALQRKQWVVRLVEEGCSRLLKVQFPDNSVAERTDAGWLDSAGTIL